MINLICISRHLNSNVIILIMIMWFFILPTFVIRNKKEFKMHILRAKLSSPKCSTKLELMMILSAVAGTLNSLCGAVSLCV